MSDDPTFRDDDPDVLRLERLLRPLAARDDADAARAAVARIAAESRRRARRRVLLAFAGVAAAAAAVLVVVAPWTPRGRWIETADASRDVDLGPLSDVTLAPRTRLQVREVSDAQTLLYLERGAIEARVSADARPGFFQVDTDAARCVDLGCRYTLEVADDGEARVRVTTGQVAFRTETRDVFVPSGAVCVARKGRGPGTPRFEDAPPEVAAAFDALDAAPLRDRAARRRLADAALATVRAPRDTLPAWHLLQEDDADVARAAAARIEAVAGACSAAPADASPAELRDAWRDELHARCW